jgi:hypothetical protein
VSSLNDTRAHAYPDPGITSRVLALFLAAGRRDRFRSQLASRRGRQKLRARLAHFGDLDERVCVPVPTLPADGWRAWVLHTLQSSSAPQYCYLVSEDSALDGQHLALCEALDRVLGHEMGTLISCIPGRLGFFEGEDPGHRWVLRR